MASLAHHAVETHISEILEVAEAIASEIPIAIWPTT